MRQSHYLPGNSNNETPHDVIWVDTETMACFQEPGRETHHLRFGYAAHRRRKRSGEWGKADWVRFTSIDQFWDWVESKLHGKCKLYVFAHNWGFDFPVMHGFTQLRHRGFDLVSSVIESPPIIMKWRRKPNTIQIVDTLNLWRVPLAVLGKQIGLDKLPMPGPGATAEDWDTYGKRDVEVIMTACIQWWDFLQRNDLGGFAPTLASQALRTYRHRFMKHNILIDDNSRALALSRSAYYGGRTEALYIGLITDLVYRLDINSMYPWVMREEAYPARLIGHYRRVNVDELATMLTKYCVTARVLIETDEPAYPVLTKDHLLFPTGYFWTNLSTPELIYAMEHGHIKSVEEVAVYEPAVLFREFVDYMYDLRLQAKAAGNEAESYMWKILQNSLYGKFGQRGMRYEIVDTVEGDDIRVWQELDLDTKSVYNFRQYGGVIEQRFNEPESRESHPAIAAHVTAYARMALWRLIKRAGAGHVFYTDTDSLWVDEVGLNRLRHFIDNTQLGRLKLEGMTQVTEIYGAKDYRLDSRGKTKGIRKNAVKVAPSTYEQDKFSTLKGLLRTGQADAPVVERQRKALRRVYSKGVISPAGWVSPWSLPLEGRRLRDYLVATGHSPDLVNRLSNSDLLASFTNLL